VTSTVTLIDAIRVNAHNIPPSTPKVAGYGTGIGDVPWTDAEWDLFPHSGLVVIDQTPGGAVFAAGQADVYDMEALAGTPGQFPALVKARIAKGITWSTGYGTDSTLAAAKAALDGAGPHGWYYGHVDCWLANWNLSEAQAAALVDTLVQGLTCRAVQWASPSSNPNTIVPGGTQTLAQAQVDLSVAEAAWHPAPPPPHNGLYRHVTTASATFAEIARSRNEDPAVFYPRSFAAFTEQDWDAIANVEVGPGFVYYTLSP
jgi:hypothetical protein